MAERVALILVWVSTLYMALGFLFAIAFVSLGARKVDPQTVGAGLGFRLLLIPGVTALWPLLLSRWIAGNSDGPGQENPHQ